MIIGRCVCDQLVYQMLAHAVPVLKARSSYTGCQETVVIEFSCTLSYPRSFFLLLGVFFVWICDYFTAGFDATVEAQPKLQLGL